MAPTRQKKRKSTESTSSVDIQGFPAPPSQSNAIATRSPAITPTNQGPTKKPVAVLTLAQKQQLIDNLQQEVTERARRLRQQYSAQAQDLRIRIERRVTRIPMHLRRANMGDLIRKYNETGGKSGTTAASKFASTLRNSPSKNILQESRGSTRQSPAPSYRGAKRLSDEMSTTDKENEDVENPKKRPRGAPFAPLPPTRTTSQRPVAQPQILSPKSSNTLAQLTRVPVRPINSSSPPKFHADRPTSPLKSAGLGPAGGASSILTNMVEKAKSTRAATARKVTGSSNTSSAAPVGRGRKGAAQPAAAAPRVGRGRGNSDSNSSETSSGTTIVRRAVAPADPAAPGKKAPAKRTVMSTIKGMGGQGSKKLPAGKPAAPAASGGRVLRKRN